jgi:rare lipoprotein A
MRGCCGSPTRRFVPVGVCAALGLLLAHCSNPGNVDPRYGVAASPRLVDRGEPVPKGGGTYRVGQSYTIAGRVYFPEENPHYRAEGLASWYGDDFHGRETANGEIFDLNGLSAAHPTLPLPSYVRVTNLSNGRSVIVRVNDRGPYKGDRIIDVSVKTAKLLGFLERGTASVRVEYVGRAPLGGSDDRVLEATYRQNEPAPPPGSVKLAAAPIVPAAYRQLAGTRLTSASADDPVPLRSRLMAYAHSPIGLDGTEQFLNGRGLY